MRAEPKQTFDALCKVAVIGDSSVGKTNLLLRYVSTNYTVNHMTTIGIDFKVKSLDLNGFKLKMQIWDTAGQERFRNLTSTIYQGAEAVLLRKSYQNVKVWLNDLRQHAPNGIIVVLVGNKVDCAKDRQVSTAEGENLAKEIGAKFFETSAIEGINVNETFQFVGETLKAKVVS